VKTDVYLVHNHKTNAQIGHFKDYFRGVESLSEVIHLLAYEGLFLQVGNCFEPPLPQDHAFLGSHAAVLNWLIKYRLPEGRYVFVDHDCIVHASFIRNLSHAGPETENKLFVFPDREGRISSLTAPAFYCDTSVREHLTELCDIGWTSNIVRHDRGKLPDRGKLAPTATDFERKMAKSCFDDTLYNVVRYLLSRWPALVRRLGFFLWRDLDHMGHGGAMRLSAQDVELLRKFFRETFQPAFFACDKGSASYDRFFKALQESGLSPEFGAG
jgi:hypothetical protein